MKKVLILTIHLLLAACSGITIPLVVNTPLLSSTALPDIHSPTPPFIPSNQPTLTIPPMIFTITGIPFITPTTTLPASTQTPSMQVDIIGCNTSFDITHQMGEVTNAYALVRNNSANDLTDLCATLTASDEDRHHPDKTSCFANLPNGFQVTMKLTVDTGYKEDTSIRVDVIAKDGALLSITRSSCRVIGLPGWVPDKIGLMEPIP